MSGDQTLIGYTDRISVVAGDRQKFMVSSAPDGPFNARLVRLICGDSSERGAGFSEQPVKSPIDGEYPGGDSMSGMVVGSWGKVSGVRWRESPFHQGTVSVYFMPTRLGSGHEQVLLDCCSGGFTITIAADGLRFRQGSVPDPEGLQGDREPAALTAAEMGPGLFPPLPVRPHCWHWISLQFSQLQAMATLIRYPNNRLEKQRRISVSVRIEGGLAIRDGAWTIGARLAPASASDTRPGNFYNGRLELPWIANEALDAAEALELSENTEALRDNPRIVAAWDFSELIGGSKFVDIGPNQADGRFYNTPTRAVRGVRWDGSELDWKVAPRHYGAVHFHEDDLTDARWQPKIEWDVPDDLSSGIYALKLERDHEQDYVPFFVRPSPGQERARVLFLVPTATYLAYANNRISMNRALAVAEHKMTPVDEYLYRNPAVGLSLYDRHADGSGVHFSSYLRPVRDLKPGCDPWAFTADTNINAWLHRSGIPFDVITDHDLHREGARILSDYSVVVTGSHPEYVSTNMLDALEAFMGGGGRLMYMGANGFYWRIAFDPENPAIIELRRAEGHGSGWNSEPGEAFHAFSGEYGGLWRNHGRPPNRLVGVGFGANSNDGTTGYRRLAAADDPRARFIFEGTSEGERFGHYGSIFDGGAVCQEIDRWNPDLGSPWHALVVACSSDIPSDFRLCREDLDAAYPNLRGPRLRADMTFFETASGGAVFSTGSIGFAGSLSHNGYDNDICRIATNVLRRFIDPRPFPYPGEANGDMDA